MPVPEKPKRGTSLEALPEALGIRLTPLEEAFAWAYLETHNLADAYYAARPDSKVSRGKAGTYGSALYAKAHVRERMRDIRMPALERAGITLDRTLLELKRLAYMDPRKLFKRVKGQMVLKEVDELDADTAAALSSIDLKGAGEDIGKIVGVTFKQKAQAIDMLMKHFGGYEKDNHQRGDNLKVQVLLVAPTQEPRPD